MLVSQLLVPAPLALPGEQRWVPAEMQVLQVLSNCIFNYIFNVVQQLGFLFVCLLFFFLYFFFWGGEMALIGFLPALGCSCCCC